MLDLATLFLSMGLQEDLEAARQSRKNEVFETTDDSVDMGSAVSQVVDAVDSAISSVEAGVTAVASAMIPEVSMVEAAAEPITIDLSLPSSSTVTAK